MVYNLNLMIKRLEFRDLMWADIGYMVLNIGFKFYLKFEK